MRPERAHTTHTQAGANFQAVFILFEIQKHQARNHLVIKRELPLPAIPDHAYYWLIHSLVVSFSIIMFTLEWVPTTLIEQKDGKEKKNGSE